MDYKKMTDSELATIMVNYINRVNHLKGLIAQYIDNPENRNIPEYRIKEEYTQLKTELREIAEYLDKSKNRDGSNLYKYYFSPSIKEAIAFGFLVPTNHKVNQKMFSSVSDAHYKLKKYYSLEQWGSLM